MDLNPNFTEEPKILVITRRRDQTVSVGPAKIMVVEVKADAVWLGIEAPANMPITRDDAKKKQPKPEQARAERLWEHAEELLSACYRARGYIEADEKRFEQRTETGDMLRAAIAAVEGTP